MPGFRLDLINRLESLISLLAVLRETNMRNIIVVKGENNIADAGG